MSKTRFLGDLSGTGARIAGGRWNEKGTAVVYTAPNRSLASVEYLVHVPMGIKPGGLVMATFEVPASASRNTIIIEKLPADWEKYPAPPELARIGSDWVSLNTELLLYVPSVVVRGEFNVLINPAHPDIRHIRAVKAESYRFDQRLIRKNGCH